MTVYLVMLILLSVFIVGFVVPIQLAEFRSFESKAIKDIEEFFKIIEDDRANMKNTIHDLYLQSMQIPEINPDNYTHDEVCELNEAMIRLHLDIKAADEVVRLGGAK